MDYVKLRTHVVQHARFLSAGSAARDLWLWGMLWCGAQESDGEIPMVVLLASSWGKSGKGNVQLANKLVEVGLWDRTDTGFRVRKWAEQGNLTRDEIASSREAARGRMRARRGATPASHKSLDDVSPMSHSDPAPSQSLPLEPQVLSKGLVNSVSVRANEQRTSQEVPTSTSTSLSSGSGSDLETRARETAPDPPSGVHQAVPQAPPEQPRRAGPVELAPDSDASPPGWWRGACDTAAMAVGDVTDRTARWHSYAASRRRKIWAVGREDAVGWLCDVILGERNRKPPPRERRYDKAPGLVEHEARKQTREEAVAAANEIMAEGRKWAERFARTGSR